MKKMRRPKEKIVSKALRVLICVVVAIGVWVYVQQEKVEEQCRKDPLSHTQCVNLLKTAEDKR